MYAKSLHNFVYEEERRGLPQWGGWMRWGRSLTLRSHNFPPHSLSHSSHRWPRSRLSRRPAQQPGSMTPCQRLQIQSEAACLFACRCTLASRGGMWGVQCQNRRKGDDTQNSKSISNFNPRHLVGQGVQHKGEHLQHGCESIKQHKASPTHGLASPPRTPPRTARAHSGQNVGTHFVCQRGSMLKWKHSTKAHQQTTPGQCTDGWATEGTVIPRDSTHD